MAVLDRHAPAHSAQQLGAILSQRRISSTQTAVCVAIEQLEALGALLPAGTHVLADRWYATVPVVSASSRLHLDALVRLKRNLKLYRKAPLPFLANEEPHARMATCFTEANQRRGGSLMARGRAPISAASRSRSKPGTTCTCGKHGK
jgi:hypothetical protein